MFGNISNFASNAFGALKSGYEGAKRFANVLGTVGKVGYNIGRGIFDYIANNEFNRDNYYFTKNETPAWHKHNAPMPSKKRSSGVLPPVSRQHERVVPKPIAVEEVKEEGPYEFWTNHILGGLIKRRKLK